MIKCILWRSVNFHETLMSFRSRERMGDQPGDGPCWNPRCPAVARPLTGGLEKLLFSAPLPTLTRETKWKQSWNWRYEIQEIKMILFIISEK